MASRSGMAVGLAQAQVVDGVTLQFNKVVAVADLGAVRNQSSISNMQIYCEGTKLLCMGESQRITSDSNIVPAMKQLRPGGPLYQD
jgi:hypothetical protein